MLADVPEFMATGAPRGTDGKSNGRCPASAVKDAFAAYCDYYTDTAQWLSCRANANAKRAFVVRCLQARHDSIVPYSSGLLLERMLQKVHMGGCDACQGLEAGACGRASMQDMAGGHVWGFVCAPKRLPAAVLQAVTDLEAVL